MPTAVVTGITGQDGSYLAELLVAQGWAVHGAVRPGETPPAHLAQVAPLELHEVDLLDDRALERLIASAAPDEVYNLAGVSSVAASWQDPVTTLRVNAEVVTRLLETLWRMQASAGRPVRFLQASSAEIFAGSGQSPQDEQTPVCPRSPYGAAKAFAHHMVQIYRARGLHAVNAVLYNHESPRRPPTFVTRKVTQGVAAIADGRADDLVLGNLDAQRDWGWAPEYVEGMTLALRYAEPQDWVLATGRSQRVRDFVAAAFRHVGIEDWERHVRSDPSFIRTHDAVELVGNAAKAERLLGWVPRVGLDELVARMVEADRAGVPPAQSPS